MPFTAFEAYIERLPARMAELKLLLADAVSVPHMKKGDRRALLNSWSRLVRMNSQPAEARPASPWRLKLMGIGVRHVEKRKPG